MNYRIVYECPRCYKEIEQIQEDKNTDLELRCPACFDGNGPPELMKRRLVSNIVPQRHEQASD